MRGYVIRKQDGSYFMGCGYGGPKNPVPYFQHDLKQAKVYKTLPGAVKAAKNYGGYPGAAELNEWDEPVAWLGFMVEYDGRARGWKLVNVAPRDFDPQDYTMNNGQL